MSDTFFLLLAMVLTTYVIRVLPLTLIRKPIQNRFLKSFLYYVPYVTLAVMTFPAIIQATQSPLAGVFALLVGIVAAYFSAGLLPVAMICCVVVLLTEFFLI